ncbi:MAG: hypothetical protein HQK55_09765, partial [Deltaproteobacteria bacterium]|nr:hypothetical protein [Deltaproteobacteria bacterium]
MTPDKEKKVSRLFPMSPAPKKKGSCSRHQTNGNEVSIDPLVLRLILLLILAVATVFLAFPMPDSLLMGEVADRDVKADRDLIVEDRVGTKEKRETARRTSPTILDLDDLATMGLKEQVHQVF